MSEPERRRRRPAISCALCRRRKIRCNRETPCSNCLKSGNPDCIYENYPSQPSRPRPNHQSVTGAAQFPRSPSTSRQSVDQSQASDSLNGGPTAARTISGQQSARDVESMKAKIAQLEGQLSRVNQTTNQSPATHSNPSIEANTSTIGGTWYIHHEDGSQPIVRGITHKSRQFGQTHWITNMTMLQEILLCVEPLLREPTCPVFRKLQKAKSLARVIKKRRNPVWPCVIQSDLPSKNVSDELVDCYLRTWETVYRIVHVPTFRRDYEALWVSESNPDPTFLILVKLVLAIGATAYDDNFSLRASAIQWVYEAQTLVSQPNTKPFLNLQALQVHVLLLLAREVVDVGGDSVYISTGNLFRRAVIMGLHKDPEHLPQKSPFVTEMRRRIWSTILELCVQSSLTSGGPPFFSMDDFDAEPPSNLDDDQLETEEPIAKSEDQFTQVSVAIAFRKTLPIRLAVVKFLNNIRTSGTYEETLRLDAELRTSYKSLIRVLQSFKSSTDPESSRFGLRIVDLLMQRYTTALHSPFFGAALGQTAFAFSRQVIVESSLKILYIIRPSLYNITAQSRNDTRSPSTDAISRVAACGANFLRLATHQAALFIAVELKTQLKDDDSLDPVPIRPDLLAVMYDSVDWSLQCIKNGETNIKGHLMTRMIVAQIEALRQNVAEHEIPPLLVNAAIEAEEACILILEKLAGQDQVSRVSDESYQTSLGTPSDSGWDLTITNDFFGTGNTDSVGWLLDESGVRGGAFW